MKICSECHKEKEDKEFINKYGKEVKCCEKCRARKKEYRIRTKEHFIEWKKANKDNINKQRKEYRDKNKDKISEKWKKYYKDNSESLKEKSKKYRINNIEKVKSREKLRYQRERNKLLEAAKERSKVWYSQNRDYALQKCKERYLAKGDKIREEYRILGTMIARYKTYGKKLTVDEDPIRGENGELLVRCFRCGKYFSPTNSSVKNRVNAINGTHHGEAHLYCSTECKEACPIYNAKYNSVSKNSRDDFRFPEWSNTVKERDRYVCQKCGNKENLYAHHILPIATHPQLADDVNNGITLCKECHSEVHQLEGCRYNQLRKKKSSWC